MTEENVDIVRRALEAGGRNELEALFDLCDPEYVGHIPDDYPLLAGTYRGYDGIRDFLAAWLEAWEEFRLEPEEFFDGGDAVVVSVYLWGRGRGSGVEIEGRWVYRYKLRDGKILRWQVHGDLDEALQVAGLRD